MLLYSPCPSRYNTMQVYKMSASIYESSDARITNYPSLMSYLQNVYHLMYLLTVIRSNKLDVRGSVHHSIIHKEYPTRCNSVSKFYFMFIWSSTCFRRHTAHHPEPKIALASSGFAYVEGCWTCSWWTASSNYTSNNPPRMQNQRMLVEF